MSNEQQPKQAFNTGIQIKHIPRRLPEIGKIKIGKKGEKKTSKNNNEFRLPKKLDHFWISTLEQGEDDNFVEDKRTTQIVREYLGEKYGASENVKITRIPVILPFDTPEMNCMTRIARYTGSQCTGVSDGETYWEVNPETNQRKEIPEPSPRDLQNNWKWNGTLSVIIQGAERVGGVWKFRTTGYNSIVDLMSSMDLIALHTGGRLAGVPLELVVRPRRATDPKGRAQTIYSVTLEFSGTQEELTSKVTHLLEKEYRNDAHIKMLEQNAMRTMSADDFDDEAGVADEFYPPANAKPSYFAEAEEVEGDPIADINSEIDAKEDKKEPEPEEDVHVTEPSKTPAGPNPNEEQEDPAPPKQAAQSAPIPDEPPVEDEFEDDDPFIDDEELE